ncbi:MAG TPA: hypothetical protein VNL14_14810 [Candidatus Acidoferrales bacterium]|nr:hypothetical protein [Candidatus Acidoferrales bacterium]
MTGASLTAVGLVALFLAQACLMLVDEWLFHRRRGLEPWERWGHPLDSIVYAAALLVPALAPPRAPWGPLYAALAVASCLLITKDEWVHARSCAAGEHWVHAVLFLIHPAVLIFSGFLWASGEGASLRLSLPVAVAAFAAYQIVAGGGRGARARDGVGASHA